jgi:hypothetical protein
MSARPTVEVVARSGRWLVYVRHANGLSTRVGDMASRFRADELAAGLRAKYSDETEEAGK